jgi:predicted HTH domain antitoxin
MTPKNLLIFYTNNFKIVQFVSIHLSINSCFRPDILIFMTMSNYGSWSLPQLKDELRKRKARISGRKHELIER